MENALEPDQRYGYPNTMFVRFLKLCFLISAFVCGLLLVEDGSGVNASEPKKLVKNGAWSAYSFKEGGKLTCYMYSQPTQGSGNFKKRGDPHIMVTRRRGVEMVEEVSVTSGYPYKEKSKIKLNIDGRKFEFGIYVKNEHAWSDDAKEDKAVVKAMRRGNKLTVRGTSRKDTYSLDTYSLKGFIKTHKAIVKACP